MTTFDELLLFIKRQRRINATDTQFDSVIADNINSAYRTYCRRLQSLGSPGLRATTTFAIVASTQDYALASDFDRLIDNSVRYYTSGQTNYQLLTIVAEPDAELWESMPTTNAPLACRVITGATGTARKLRIMPAFTETGNTVAYAYYQRPATLAAASTLQLPELADAVAWNVIGGSYAYFRDDNDGAGQANAFARAKAEFSEVLGTLTA